MNRLKDSLSPYLLQHAENPVDWFPWGDEALEKAKKEGKPIFLSIGYAACHWCHVMAHESFENETIARFMNERFVNVKLDREERPDLDEIYMSATLALSGSGGWPMSVFLTPERKPFFAGTYFPPDARYGRPGFLQLLESIADAWETQREEIFRQSDRLAHAIGRMATVASSPGLLTEDIGKEAVRALLRNFDDRDGGFGGAPKFPNPAAILVLLREHRRSGDEDALRAASFTLEKMDEGGIYDHLGGGFHRYSTDEVWLVPHFEKMLYDQAQLARAYLAAFLAKPDMRWLAVVQGTLDYVLREMQAPEGGFYSAQDADSEGVEGKFFVWSPAEIDEALGKEDGALFAKVYDVTRRGNFEGKNILHPIQPIDDALAERLAPMRAKLLAVREKRVKPLRDDKVLADWNGLMLQALAEAGAVLDEPRYLDAARRCARFFSQEMLEDGRLLRVWRAGKKHTSGLQADYASLSLGLVALYQATFEIEWLELARSLAKTMIELFWAEDGGFYATEAGKKDLIARAMTPQDGALPSGSSLAVHALLALHRLTGETELEEKAVATFRLFRETMERASPALLVMIGALQEHQEGPVEIALSGKKDDPELARMIRAAREYFLPGHAVALGKLDASADEAARTKKLVRLLDGKEPKDGKATAWVCRNFACESPVTSAEELGRKLAAKPR